MSKEKEVRRTSVPLVLIFLCVSSLPSSPSHTPSTHHFPSLSFPIPPTPFLVLFLSLSPNYVPFFLVRFSYFTQVNAQVNHYSTVSCAYLILYEINFFKMRYYNGWSFPIFISINNLIITHFFIQNLDDKKAHKKREK